MPAFITEAHVIEREDHFVTVVTAEFVDGSGFAGILIEPHAQNETAIAAGDGLRKELSRRISTRGRTVADVDLAMA